MARRFSGGSWLTLGLMAFVVVFLVESSGYARIPRAFPQLIGWLSLAALLADLVVRQLRFGKGKEEEARARPQIHWRRLGGMVGGMLVFPLAIWLFGFVIASFAVVSAVSAVLSGGRFVAAILGGTGMTAFIYLVFQVAFNVNLPSGLLFG